MAIDNACGWPYLTVLPDGEIMVYIWPYPVHGYTEGAAEAWQSSDGGHTWFRAGVPVPHEPTENRMNVAAGLNNAGQYTVLASGWNNRRYPAGWRPEGVYNSSSFYRDSSELTPIPAVYFGGEKGWRQYAAVDTVEPEGTTGVPFGRIAPISDTETGVFIYHKRVIFYVSEDNGKTWSRRGELPDEGDFYKNYNETTWIKLENGDLYAASRRSNVGGFRSTDNGFTWTKEEDLTLLGQHPADLTRMKDGRILLTYGVRNRGMRGIAYRIADTEARNWDRPAMLVHFPDAGFEHTANPMGRADLGYPSTVSLADGTLVTAYYVESIEGHNRYHVGVVRWALRDDSNLVMTGGDIVEQIEDPQ